MRLRSVLVAATVVAALVSGCGTEPDESDDQDQSPPKPGQPQTSPPGDEVTVLPYDGAGTLAIGVSRVLYDRAPVVYLAAEDDPASQRVAGAAAAESGVPLLLTPPDPGGPAASSPAPEGTPRPEGTPAAGGTPAPGGTPGADGAALREELARLGAAAVRTVGDAAAGWGERLGADVRVVRVDPGRAAGLPTPDGAGAAEGDADELPPVEPPEPLRSVAVLGPEAAHTLAATTTARAAGARVLATGATDPRTDPRLIEALSERPPTHTVALGAGFHPADRLRDRLRVVTTGVQLPGGGQVLFPHRRFVALYGHPGDPALGALGEQPRDEAIARAKRVAGDYRAHTDGPVVPALEIITTIASAGAGPAGDYSRRTPIGQLRPWIEAARDAGLYVVLDLQPGHTDFLTQAKEYRELLTEPHVGLALDPEWRLAPDQRHMVNIGSVDAAEVNRVIRWLADLTAEHRLPQKLLILHQFRLDMITDRAEVNTGRDELAVLIHADGFGTPGQKHATWDRLHRAPPPGVWWGWKNFYDEDRPTFSPAQTVRVEPSPLFISYQ